MPEQEYIEDRPQPAKALLTLGKYYDINYNLSEAKGWQLGMNTERCFEMNPTACKINIQYDEDGNESSYEEAYVMDISSEIQRDYPELIEGIELVSSFVPLEKSYTEIIATGLSTEVEEWFLNHYVKVGKIDGLQVIWLENEVIENLSSDVINYFTSNGITLILPA